MMNNAEKFKQIFGLRATELWSMRASDLFTWLERDVEITQPDHIAESDRKVSISCGQENDLISRQAAIEALARMMPRSYTPDGSHSADEEIFRVQEVFADCIEALEILPSAQPEQKWIPCSERLPKEKQSVLVTDGSVIWVCDIISTDEGYKWEDSHGYWLDLDEWIAWMSLPKFYNGGGDIE